MATNQELVDSFKMVSKWEEEFPPSDERVGDAVHKMFEDFLIKARPNCPCWKMMAKMNHWGCDGSLEHMPEVLRAMAKEARLRRMPFVPFVVERLIRHLIKKVRYGNKRKTGSCKGE